MDTGKIRRRYVGSIVTLALFVAVFGLGPGIGVGVAIAAEEQPVAEQPLPSARTVQPVGSTVPIAIALAVGLSCVGAGYAVGHVGSAALGAASEKPELLTRSLLFVALAEGIAIYGLLVSLLLWVKL